MGWTLQDLAVRIGAQLRGEGAGSITGCAGLEDAGPGEVSFLANARYRGLLATTKAGAAIVAPADVAAAPGGLPLLIAPDPYFAFREAAVALHGFRPPPPPGVSPLAHVDPSATLGPGVAILPFAHVAAGAAVGARTVLHPHCCVGAGAVVGADCVLHPGVVVYDRCALGNRVILHANTVIGQDGFGYATHRKPGEGTVHHKIPQAGNVIVEDDVEMGANCSVDRAAVGSTVVGQGTKFSNGVVIGHGTRIGRHNLLVAQVGVAGSVRTGELVVMGGQAGVAGHLAIGDRVQLAAKTGVKSDLPGPGQYGGMPALPWRRTQRVYAAQAQLPELLANLRDARARLAALEEKVRRMGGDPGGEPRAGEPQP